MGRKEQNHSDSDSNSTSERTPRLSRRSVLAAATSAVLVGIPSQKSLAQTAEQPLSTEDIPEDTTCEVCNMKVKNFPVGNAQILRSDGKREYFCSPTCLTAYYAKPDSDNFADTANFGIGKRDKMIKAAWTRDYTTDNNIDAFNAYFVLDNNSDNIKSGIPMGKNPVPFESKNDAEEYAKSHDLKNSDVEAIYQDVVHGLDTFDFELAQVFSSKLSGSVSENPPKFTSPIDNFSDEVWTEVTEDGELDLGDLSRSIRGYRENGRVNGVDISLGDLGRLIKEYQS